MTATEQGLSKASGHAPQFVFMLSLMPRSGTNFLAELLALHPDCARCVVDEDGLLAQSRHLRRFARLLARVWEADGNLEDLAPYDPIGRLHHAFGETFKRFLLSIHDAAGAPHAPYLVSKTPRIAEVGNFPLLLPDDPLLVLLRDGRAVVESYVRSFGKHFESAVREWAGAARELRAAGPVLAGHKVLFVRYEDLVQNQERMMAEVLAFIGLDPQRFDQAAAQALPVFGSSELAAGGGKVDWKPREKAEDFNPLARASGWTERQRSRFEWLAGAELRELGYGNADTPVPRFAMWNHWRDFLWKLRRFWQKARLLPQLPRRARRILAD